MKHEKKNASIALRFRRLTRKNYGAFNTMHRVINIGTLSSLALACAYTSTVSAQNVAASSPERNLGEPDKELVLLSQLRRLLHRSTKLHVWLQSSLHARSHRPLREVSKNC